MLEKLETLPIKYNKGDITSAEMTGLLQGMLKPRMIENKMLKLLRQGKISKWFAGIGQEAIAVGVTKALEDDEFIFPLHRNLGVFTMRNVPLNKLFKQFQGKEDGFTKGRDRSFHFGSSEHHVSGMISHLGPQMCIANGIGLAYKLAKEEKVTVAFCGDGGSSEGDTHEALNIASVWDLPVLFIIENNGYGLSTPVNEQYRCKQLSDRGIGYGMEAYTIDGNNVLEVYSKVKELTTRMRKDPKPVLLECMTFRMRGHEEASGVKYVPSEMFQSWEKKDPVINFKNFLLMEGIITEAEIQEMESKIKAEIEETLSEAFNTKDIEADTKKELQDVYKPYNFKPTPPGSAPMKKMRYVDAVSDGLRQSMKRFDNLVMMGQDIAEYGGVFKITEGFVEEFGRERVRNTPLCESGILNAALGLSLKGYKSVVEMQFADFVSSGFSAIVNNLAKVHYRWNVNADIVVRMPTGAGVGAGPFHSQSNEAWFYHVPGLKIVYPSTPDAVKGLLCASIEDPNPVMFFEHKALYRKVSSPVHEGYYTQEIGKARKVLQGKDLSIVTYGYGVHWALTALQENPEISADLIDLQTLLPMDWETIYDSVTKCGKLIILHEDTITGGIGGEIAAKVSEDLFEFLDAPVFRVGSLDTPVPFASNLEENFLPGQRFRTKLLELWNY